MVYIGLDISHTYFDAALPQAKGNCKFDNQLSGFQALEAVLPANAHCVMEATGPYYLRLASYLYQRGIPVSVVNPLVIKRFSQMKLSRAKTDQADARLIGEYARLHQPAIWQPPVAFIGELQQESSLLEQLLKQRTALGNHQHALAQHPHISQQAAQSLTELLEKLDEQIQQLEKSIENKSKTQASELLKVLVSIPGIGLKTAIQLIIITQGFERFTSSKQLAAYVGLAPRLYESGSSVRGKVHISKLGMAQMRKLLYLCAWSACRCNLACQQLYQRLLEKGKARKLALIAAAVELWLISYSSKPSPLVILCNLIKKPKKSW